MHLLLEKGLLFLGFEMFKAYFLETGGVIQDSVLPKIALFLLAVSLARSEAERAARRQTLVATRYLSYKQVSHHYGILLQSLLQFFFISSDYIVSLFI